MEHTTNIIFICQFFNTGILLLLCNANAYGQGIFEKMFKTGYDTDFNQDWFATFGDTIIGAMMFNVWYPFVGEAMWGSIRWLTRVNDRRKANDTGGTACVTQ